MQFNLHVKYKRTHVCCLYKEVYWHIFKCMSFWLHGCCGEWEGGPINQVNHTSWVAVVTPTDRPKSVRNCCLIELFCSVVCVVTLPFWHFCWCRGYCHRNGSDLLLIVFIHRHYGTNSRASRKKFTDSCKPEVRPGTREESASPAWLQCSRTPWMPATQRKCIYWGLTLDVDRYYIGSVTTHQEQVIITLESNPSRELNYQLHTEQYYSWQSINLTS